MALDVKSSTKHLRLELVGIGTASDEEKHSDLVWAVFGLASSTSIPGRVLRSNTFVADTSVHIEQLAIHSRASVLPSTLPAVAGKSQLVELEPAVAVGSFELVFVVVAALDSGTTQGSQPVELASSVVVARAPQLCMLVVVGTAVADSELDHGAFVFAAVESVHSAERRQLAAVFHIPVHSSSSSDTVAELFGLEWLGCLLALPLLRFAVDKKHM